MEYYQIRRADGTQEVTLTGPGDLEEAKTFSNVRLAAEAARDHNRANGDGDAAVRLFRANGCLENERPIPNGRPKYLNAFCARHLLEED